MGKKTMTVPTPEPGMLDMYKDFVLFGGDFKWFFYFALCGFCAANAMTILKQTPNINYFHGCAMMVVVCFGGSTISAVMVGAPVAFVLNEALASCCLGTWTVMYLVPDLTIGLLKTSVGTVVTSINYEVMRCHVAMNCTKQAQALLASALVVPAVGRVAVIGPLIAGTLGGCGGAFMPLNKGLEPLAGGLNWRFASALLNSLWLFCSMQYPSTVEAIGMDPEWCRVCAISFLVIPPLVHMATGFAPLGANPLVAPRAADGKKTN